MKNAQLWRRLAYNDLDVGDERSLGQYVA